LNLVDPDNRRPVDYERRRSVLRDLKGCATALPQPPRNFSISRRQP
jgi:maltooligosyltrehalose synthase